MSSTCGDTDCTLTAGHGGDFHVGPDRGDGTHEMWPMAHARADAAAKTGTTGRVVARLAPRYEGTGDGAR